MMTLNLWGSELVQCSNNLPCVGLVFRNICTLLEFEAISLLTKNLGFHALLFYICFCTRFMKLKLILSVQLKMNLGGELAAKIFSNEFL